jgi:hypothetical protein
VELVGWNLIRGPGGASQWKPKPLASLLLTLGAGTGATGSLCPPMPSHLIVDTIAVNGSGALIVPNFELWSPDLLLATVRLDLSGSQAVSLIAGAVGGGTVSGINGTFQGL